MASRSELNNLAYPMFKITLDEAVILTEAINYLGNKYPEPWSVGLHAAIGLTFFWQCDVNKCIKLCQKVTKSLSNAKWVISLYSHLDIPEMDRDEGIKAHRIWIKKLLKHNGY